MKTHPVRTLPAVGAAAALAALLCAAPAAAAAPDLAVTRLELDAQNRLRVTFANQGDAEVPPGVGSLSIYIDGRPVGGYSLGNLADQSFRAPGGSVTIPTNFRLAGSLRQVLAIVDPAGAVAESNEWQNVRARSLVPAPLDGPDLSPDSLQLAAGGFLQFRVRNRGNMATAAPFPVTARVIVGGAVVADLALDLSGLPVGGVRWVVPSPAIPVTGTRSVRVLLNTPTFLSELDSTNNVREQWLPAPPSLAELDRLLALPEIGDALRWNGTSYPGWTATQRLALRVAFRKLEDGDFAGPSSPPPVDADGRISESDAWSLYVGRMAHVLRVEALHLVPWSLLDLDPAHRELLLDNLYVVRQIWGSGSPPRYHFDPFRSGGLTDWNAPASLRFLSALGLLRTTPAATIRAVSDWMRAYLMHTLVDFDPEATFQYEGPPPVDRVIYPLVEIHWTMGCSGTTYLYRALLHAVNVPVELNSPPDAFGHRRPIFPSLDLAMAHADDPYSQHLTPTGNPMPISSVLGSISGIESRYLHPPLDCVGARCNTPVQQYAYNSERDSLLLVSDRLGDYLLDRYGRFGRAALEVELTGDLSEHVLPLLSPTEIAWTLARVEAELDRLGAGDRAAGAEIVRTRMNRWALNKWGE